MSLNSSQKAANELAMARMTLRATHSPFAPPPPESTPPPAPANLNAIKLELEALRQQGLATIILLAEKQTRKTTLRISSKSHEDGVGGASLSALNQMYMDLFRQREAVKKKQRDAMLLCQQSITAGPDLIDNTGMVPTMASRIQSEVNERLAQSHANDTQYAIPTIPPQSSAPLLPVYHVQPSTTSDSHMNHVMHTPPPVTHRQFLSPIPGSPESGNNTDHEERNPAYQGQDPYLTPNTQVGETEDTVHHHPMNPVQGPSSSSTFMGPSSFSKKKNQQMTTVSPQDVRQMLDIPENEEPEETTGWQEEHLVFFADQVQYVTNDSSNNKYGYNIDHGPDEDFDDNCRLVSGLTMQTTIMSDAEQRLGDFLKNETVAIRKLIEEECSVAPTISSNNEEHETSSQESESARETSKAAVFQAEEMAIMRQDAVAWATQAVTSPNSSNDDDDAPMLWLDDTTNHEADGGVAAIHSVRHIASYLLSLSDCVASAHPYNEYGVDSYKIMDSPTTTTTPSSSTKAASLDDAERHILHGSQQKKRIQSKLTTAILSHPSSVRSYCLTAHSAAILIHKDWDERLQHSIMRELSAHEEKEMENVFQETNAGTPTSP
eukprot:scaffold34042_cov53-Attheya_sp.AAC.3